MPIILVLFIVMVLYFNGGRILKSNAFNFAAAGHSGVPRSACRIHRLSHFFSSIHSMTDLQGRGVLVCICLIFPIYNLPSLVIL